MDCNCNCFGVATAARVPVKRYNLLVPDVFPVTEPSFDKPFSMAIERKIKKLGEYLDKNEHRAPKVSRRLQRRLYAELAAGRYGYVKLAVQTYIALLLGSKPEKSNLLANELVVRTVVKKRRLLFGLVGKQHYLSFREPQLGSAVGLLLAHPAPQLRKLGVDLLIDFIKQQQTSDYVPQLEAFVPLLCDNASPLAGSPAAAATSPAALYGSASASISSGRAALAAAAAATAEQWAALRAASLRALLEHLRFCARLSYVSYHLHTITFSVLVCVEASQQPMTQGRSYQSPRAALEAGINPLDSVSRLSISHAVAASPPDIAALLVFEELAHMTRDAAEGKKVLEFVMRFLDAKGRWLDSPVLDTSIAVLQQACEAEHQRYLLFSTLLRHVAAAEQLTPAERAAVLRLAVEESRQLEQGLAAPALLLALRELPVVIASSSGVAGQVPPMPAGAAAAALPPQLPAAVPSEAAEGAAAAGATVVPAAAGGAGGQQGQQQQELELSRLPKLPSLSRRVAAAAAAAARGTPVDLQYQVVEAVQQLAARVEDGSQLVEAVSSSVLKLRAAAPISTAALQCCLAAAVAVQHTGLRTARGGAGGGGVQRTFPSLLLQQLAAVSVSWEPQQRLLAHQLLLLLMPTAADGLKEQQAAILLSAAWHEAAQDSNRPAAYVAMDCTLRMLLGAAPAAALPQVVKLVAALQQEVLAATAAVGGSNGGMPASSFDGGRLAMLTAAQQCALLCMGHSVLHALAAQLGQPLLGQLAVPGCSSVLPSLVAEPPHGLLLRGLADNDSSSGSGTASGQASAGAQQQQQQQQFWQGAAVSIAFSPADQQAAAAFLGSWRQGTTREQLQEGLAAALAAVPLFQQQQQQQKQAQRSEAAAANGRFQPLPLSAFVPRSMGNGSYGGSVASGGEGETKRAARLRSVYKHMRQISLCDGDRAMLATISQESAAEEPVPAGLQGLRDLTLLGLGLGLGLGAGEEAQGAVGAAGAGAAPKSVDEVLSDIDEALKTAEEAMERGRGPSPPWAASSTASGGGAAAGAGAVPAGGGTGLFADATNSV